MITLAELVQVIKSMNEINSDVIISVDRLSEMFPLVERKILDRSLKNMLNLQDRNPKLGGLIIPKEYFV